jgi:ABC-2 type transport system ATP-binding protein
VLLERARGSTWLIAVPSGSKPQGDFTLVSSVPQADGSTQLRIVGAPPRGVHAEPVPPSLEDAYVWLMRDQRVATESLT